MSITARTYNRNHPAEDVRRLHELAGVTAPAVVVRPDGSLDIYGDVAVIDQRPEPDLDAFVRSLTGGG
jgi:hypothetical protein